MAPKFRLVLAAFFGALVFGGVVLLLAIARRPTYPPLPSPNGYDDFVKAGRSIVGEVRAQTNLDVEALHRMIVSNAEPLRLVRQGLSRQCVFPTATAITNLTAAMTDLSSLRNVALLLKAQGQLAELNGRPAEAATNYIEILRFADQASHGGFIINLLVTMACEAIGAIPLAKLVPTLNCEQARSLLAQLDELECNRVSFEEIWRNEKQLMLHELLKNNNPLKWPSVWLETRQIFPMTQTRYNNVVAREGLLKLELALRCFRFDHGTVPTRLGELIPNYVSRVPHDPFTGQALIYKPQGTNWLLYSVGPDGVDDAGKSVTARNLKPKGDLLYDSPW